MITMYCVLHLFRTVLIQCGFAGKGSSAKLGKRIFFSWYICVVCAVMVCIP